MKTVDTDNAMFFDVDDTLVMWEETPIFNETVVITDPYNGELETLYLNNCHIRLLKRSKHRGRTIVVWSHGGFKWAEAVVKALELEEYVDLVMTKMEDYVDDLDVDEWALKNIYLNKAYNK